MDNQAEEAADRDLKEIKQQRRRHRGHKTPAKKNGSGHGLVDNKTKTFPLRGLKMTKK